MNFRSGQLRPMRTVGLVCFLLATFLRWFVHPTSGLGPDVVDAITGLFYGVSISCLLLSLRRNDRQCSGDEA
jgi:hypothetical protein